MKLKVFVQAFACVALALVSSANSTVLNVDVTGGGPVYQGTGAAPDTGTHWNGLTSATGVGSLSNLVTSTGAPTTTSFAVTSSSFGDTAAGLSLPSQPSLVSGNSLLDGFTLTYNGAFGDLGVPVVPVGSFTIGGLQPGLYNLYLYGAVGNGGNASSFTINGNTLVTDPGDLGATGATPTTIPATDNGITFVEFTNVSPDVHGTISGSFGSQSMALSAFNGLQIQSVPEPSTLVLSIAGLAILGLATLRKKFRRP